MVTMQFSERGLAMHIVTCSKCKIKLRLEKPLTKAKVRCKQCGAVFIGTSQPLVEAPEDVAAHAAAAIARQARSDDPTGPPDGVVHHAYHPVPKRPGSPWMMVVVIVAVVGIVIAIFVARYLHTHPYVKIKDEKGQIVFEGRLHKDEAARRIAAIEEKKKKLEESMKSSPTATKKPGPNGSSTSTNDETVIESRPLPDGTTSSRINREPLIDINIPIIIDPAPIVAVPGRVDFVGEVRNNYDRPLITATVSVSILNEEGTPIASGSVTVHHIPAKGGVPFSIAFKTLTASKVAGAKGYAKGNQAGPVSVCWELPSGDCKKDFDKMSRTKFVLTGLVHNFHDFDVADTEVYVDFFDKDGRHLGNATGKLEKRYVDKIPSGKKAHFRVDFGTFDPAIVGKWSARVIGRQS